MNNRYHSILRAGIVPILLLSVIFSVLAFPQQVQAGIVAGYSEYYIPGGADQLYAILYDNQTTIGDNALHNVITVSVAVDNVTIYYDHWENGYGTGTTADETYTANKGDVLTFETATIPIPHTANMTQCSGSTFPAGGTGGAANHCYDGRDRIYVAGGAVAVAQAFWPSITGTVYANAWEVYPVKPYQTSYTIPVGEDLVSLGYTDFSNTYVIVQATSDGTNVTIDNANPAPGSDLTATLNRGEVTQLYNIYAGTTVTANNPVQVQFLIGRQNASYDSRSHTTVPSSLWDTEYYSPVVSYAGTNTDIFIYNPTGSPLRINYQDSTGSGSFDVPGNSTRSFQAMTGHYQPTNSAVYLATANGTTKFWAIGEYDTESALRNWGFSLIPKSTLTSEYFVSWAPGTTTLTANGSPVFITPTEDNTTVFVDYGPADGVVDATYTLNRLQAQKILDPDNDNTGMHVWATGPIAITWGQDAQYSSTGNPYIDAGYTILPLNAEWVDVAVRLDKTANPTSISAAIGEEVEYTLSANATAYGLQGVFVTDELPANFEYVAGSTSITWPGGSSTADPSGAPGPNLSWGSAVTPIIDLNPNETLTVTYRARTVAIPTDYSTNNATVTGTIGSDTFSATGSATVVATPSDLTVIKTNDLGGDALVNSPFQWILQVANGSSSGLATFADGQVILRDSLPAGPTYGAVTVTNGSIPPGGTGSIACAVATNVLTCSASGGDVTLPTGASFKANLDVTPVATGSLVNPTGGTCQVDPDGVVSERNEGNNACPANTVTVVAPSLSITKAAVPASGTTVNPNDLIEYTITVTNTGGTTQNNIAINDPLPAGITFVAGSVDGYNATTFEYTDLFDTGTAYNQTDGASDWSGQFWTETNDDGSPTTGTITISDANNRLQLNAANGDSVERQIPGNLTGKTVTLVVDYEEVGNWDNTDYFYVEIWDGSNWNAVVTHNNDFNNPPAETYDISAYANADTRVRFRSTANTGGENAYVTSVSITYEDTVAVTGAAIHNPPDVVRGTDGFMLPVGASMTVHYQVQVQNLVPVDVTSIVNTATASSDEQLESIEASTTHPLPPGSISGQVRNDVDRDGTTGGIADPDDSGLAGATITLYTDPNHDGDPTDGVQVGSPIVTDGTGNYSFSNMPSGYYVVVETDPTDYTSVMDKDGDTTDPAYNRIPLVVTAGSNNTGNDFLDASNLGSVTGSVLEDTDNDTMGDTPIAGVTLELLDSAGNQIDSDPVTSGVQPTTAITQPDGTYTFANVTPGDYQVQETQPAGFNSLSDSDGGNPDLIGDQTLITVSAGAASAGNNFVEVADRLPQANPDTNTAIENGPAVDGNVRDGGVAAGDNADDQGDPTATVTAADQGGTTVTIGTAFTTTAGGSLTLNADGTYSYTPPTNLPEGGVLTETFNYTITDNDGDTSSTTLTITIDRLPQANPDTNAATEGGAAVTGNVITNDDEGNINATVTASDQGGTAITIGTAFTTTEGGSLTLNADGTYSYTPPASLPEGTTLTEIFNYTITDNDGDTSSSTLTITINRLPNAVDDSSSTLMNTPVTTPNVLTNDDLGDTPTSITAFDGTSANGGTVTDNGDGTFDYDPPAGFTGTDTFTYTITDSNGDTSTATVSITVNSTDFTVTKTVTGVDTAGNSVLDNPGEVIEYQIEVANTGTLDLTGVTVSDPLLQGTNGTFSGPIESLSTNGILNVGETWTYTGTYTVQQADFDNYGGGDGAIDNTVTVDTNEASGQTDSASVVIVPQPGINVAKTITNITINAPQEIQVTYSILVENTGNVPLSNIQVTDDLATAFALADSFSVVSVLSGTLSINSNFDGDTDIGANPTHINLLDGTDSLAPGTNGTITLVVLVDTGGRADTYTNTAVSQGTPPSGPDVTDSDSIPGPSFIDPALTKAVNPSQASVGDTVTFTITVFNNGNVGATGVVVTDILPDNLDYVSATSIDTATSLPRGTITVFPPRTVQVDIGNLAVTDVIEITIVTQVNSLGQPPIQNTATLVADPPPAGISPDPMRNNVSAASLQILTPTGNGGLGGVQALPATGFAPNKMTIIPEQTVEQAYSDLGDLWLEIPRLGVKAPVVGVPKSGETWNVDWLWEQAGWLQGSAYPTWQGNSVLTGHVYLPSGEPGPFVNLSKLRWGDTIIVHAFGQRHIYEVRTNHIVLPNDLSPLTHEEKAWLTLLTCKGYDESSDTYKYRIEVRAVLTKVVSE